MNVAAMREEFEEVFSSQGEWPQAVERNADGGYRLAQTASAWETWQTAWEAGAEWQRSEYARLRQSDDELLG